MQGVNQMNFNDIVFELLCKIKKLEAQVSSLETKLNDATTIKTKESNKYGLQ